MKLSLKSQIVIPFLALIFITSIAIIGSVLIATRNNINNQIEESLHTGKRVFERLMSARGDQLISSSEIAVGDFGFKSAIASNDKNTVLSALENYQKRLGVDLITIHKLDGSLFSSTLELSSSLDHDFIKAIKENGGLLTAIAIDKTVYQVAILPVMAPTTIAWATVGVAIDNTFADELKRLTNVDISFIGSTENGNFSHISTLSDSTLKNMDMGKPGHSEMLQFSTSKNEELLSLHIDIAQHDNYKIHAYVYSSLSNAYNQYKPLQWQILGISLLALVFSAIGALLISKNITQPIAFFVRAAKRISDGNYVEETSQCVQNTTEISELESSFKKMQEGIADRETKILYQAYHDTLTGLPNRTNIKETINTLINNDKSTGFSVVSINIVGFSQINDTFGFDVGDDFLKTFSSKLQQSHATTDNRSARLSADDFITLLSTACHDTLSKEAKNLQNLLETSVNISGIDMAVSIRLGIATYPEHGTDAEQLLRRSGIALTIAETNKRNFAFYEIGEEKEHIKRIKLISDLGDAIKNNDLIMYYQPKIDLHSKTVSQVEALIGWIHADLGFIPPDDFIGLAESSGLMPDLTRWVLTSVAEQTKKWRQEGINAVVAVNLSAHDIAHDGLPGFISLLLANNQLVASDLMLEITESAVMDNPDYAIGILHQLKALDLELSIDDFGTGYSSLSQLKSMPVDELKIDKSFILNLEHSADDQTIVQSTIQLGHNIGLRIVAEGVETQGAWHLLEQWGCDKLQGYFISRPMPAADFAEWYNTYIPADYCINQTLPLTDSLSGNA